MFGNSQNHCTPLLPPEIGLLWYNDEVVASETFSLNQNSKPQLTPDGITEIIGFIKNLKGERMITPVTFQGNSPFWPMKKADVSWVVIKLCRSLFQLQHLLQI